MHCQISIFEIKMMVKIGVIFMPFSNPTCHLPSTANLPLVSLKAGKLTHISEIACRIWKWHDNDTYFHHQFYLKNANLTVHYITVTYFFSWWPAFTIPDIVQYALKLWRAKGIESMNGNSKFLIFPNLIGILNQKKLLPTLIYQFEHLYHCSGTP